MSMDSTLTSRILAFVAIYPGRTAWGVAKELTGRDAERVKGSVSSLLNQLAKAGRLRRERGMRGSWVYYRP